MIPRLAVSSALLKEGCDQLIFVVTAEDHIAIVKFILFVRVSKLISASPFYCMLLYACMHLKEL